MFKPRSQKELEDGQCVCLGMGRFLRAVFVPMLEAIHFTAVLAQPRGNDVVQYMSTLPDFAYEYDVIASDGSTATKTVRNVIAVGSLGNSADREVFMSLPSLMPNLSLIGLGVTEVGLQSNSQSINDLAELLFHCFKARPDNFLSIINTDNLPNNGVAICTHVLSCTFTRGLNNPAFLSWIDSHVTFHVTMVDRIVAQRGSDPFVPLTEPLPRKALVIEDTNHRLPPVFGRIAGVVIRHETGEILKDQKLKLRVLNATHTAVAPVMALSRCESTSACVGHPYFIPYTTALFELCILPASVQELNLKSSEVRSVFEEWKVRLLHPTFGMDPTFVCQNSIMKLGLRLLPSVPKTSDVNSRSMQLMAFAVASMLRYLTPMGDQQRESELVFQGYSDPKTALSCEKSSYEYTRGLHADHVKGLYEFKDANGAVPLILHKLISGERPSQSNIIVALDQCIRLAPQFDATHEGHQSLALAASLMFEKMVFDRISSMDVLSGLLSSSEAKPFPVTAGLRGQELEAYVRQAVNNVEVIDIHTHLFPPSHGPLYHWGIDRLLTYHYLVAESFMVLPKSEITHEEFYELPLVEQADLVWKTLFVDRTPISEACQGVLTTLRALGLETEVLNRDLAAIRRWYQSQTPDGFRELVFRMAKIKYVVMTNIPFDGDEAHHWLAGDRTLPDTFRSALRIDALLKPDWSTIQSALSTAGYDLSLNGLRRYLSDWIERINPVYLMASLPSRFVFPSSSSDCVFGSADGASLLSTILIPLAEKYNLAIGLKLGAVRGVVSTLQSAGDGLERVDIQVLGTICTRYPNVKFLATFLSRENQHEACVMAQKLNNLHLYGCWWYCNIPSLIADITSMRLQLLGSAFTAQHSDCRVLDQLIYKWQHSRVVIADALVKEYTKLESSWILSPTQIDRDVRLLFGGAYEAFLAK